MLLSYIIIGFYSSNYVTDVIMFPLRLMFHVERKENGKQFAQVKI